MGPIGCPETSVNNYKHTLRNHPEDSPEKQLESVGYIPCVSQLVD
jgi:hypothetical protein